MEEKAIQLIQVDSKGTFILTEEGKYCLEQYQGNISFVAVAGKYRTGKSFLLNKLLQIQGRGFKVDSATDACTQGIWMWSKPIFQNGLNIFFIDTEGSSSTDKDQRHDAKIFALAILMSSYFIFNSVGCIDELAMQQLQLTTSISRNIAISQYGSENDEQNLSMYAPGFLWVLRDFVLEIQNQQGQDIQPNEYLENALLNDTQSQKTQNIRKALCSFFKQRDCVTMVRPVERESDLQNLDYLPENQIRPKFLQKIQEIRQLILQKVGPKMLNGTPLNSRMFCSMIESFTSKINEEHGIPSIATAWEAIVERECLQAKEEAENLYMEQLQQNLSSDEPLSYIQLLELLRNLRDTALDQFDNVAGIKEKNENYENYKIQLKETIDQKEQDILGINEQLSKEKSYDILQQKFMEINLNVNRNIYKAQNVQDFNEDFKIALLKYKDSYNGPSKGTSLVSFIQQFEKPILMQFINTLESQKGVDKQHQEELNNIKLQKQADFKAQLNIKNMNCVRLGDKLKKIENDTKENRQQIQKLRKQQIEYTQLLQQQGNKAQNHKLEQEIEQQKQQIQMLQGNYQSKRAQGYRPKGKQK